MAEHLPQTRPIHSHCTVSSVSSVSCQAHSPSRGKIACCAQDHRRLQSCHFNHPALMPFQTTVLFPSLDYRYGKASIDPLLILLAQLLAH